MPTLPAARKSARFFISYRSQDPDLSLAHNFYEALKAAGHEAFMAGESIRLGEKWPQRIDEELKLCDYFLLLLSERSATSEMVTEEVRQAKELRDTSDQHKPVILPIRVNFPWSTPLNYDLRGYLQQIQQREWNSPADTSRILPVELGDVSRAIELNGFQLQEAEPLAKGLVGKVSNPQDVVKEVLTWTGGQPFLTQKLCQLIPADIEAAGIEELVRSRIIENWESQDEPEHLRTIRDRILRNEQRAGQMLGLYKQILQQERIPADDSLEQMELRLTGLVLKRQAYLEVYNRIYKKVFDKSWVNKQLAELRPQFYREAITAWLASNYQDESCLLRGDELKNAQKWAAVKNLSKEDNDFLNASRELRTKELEEYLGPTKLKFKNEEVFSVSDLIDKCDKYPDITKDYLFNSEYLEEWLFLRSETHLANLSRKIVEGYKQEKRRGVEMFVRELCRHLGRPPHPKILNILALLGSTFIIITDLTIYPLKIIGIEQAAIGWLVVGSFVGGAIGLIQSLKRIEQYSYLGKVYLIAIAIPFILLITGLITANFQDNIEFFPNIVLVDDFKHPSKEWNKDTLVSIKNGGLFHPGTKNNNFKLSIWGDKNQIFKDFDFSVDAKKVNGTVFFVIDELLISSQFAASPDNQSTPLPDAWLHQSQFFS
ncbi:toll/interleukin-1 receptor domain-containing protein [Nostoc favosum]